MNMLRKRRQTVKKGTANKGIENPPKISVYLSRSLGCSVIEFPAGLFVHTGRTLDMTVRTDWRRGQPQAIQQLQFANAAVQVGSARTNSISEIHFISVFGPFGDVKNISVDTKVGAVIEHGQGTEEFLED